VLSVAKMVAYSVLPLCLDHASALLHSTSASTLIRLQVAHNSLTRVFCQALCSASASELCQQLHWLPVRQCITYKLAVIAYRTRNLLALQLTYLTSSVHAY